MWKRFKKNKLALTCLGIMVFYFILAFFAPLIAPSNPYEIQALPLNNPSWQHWFGTDQLGRDVLSRVIYGARIPFPVAILSGRLALVAGMLLGVTGGFFGGWLDTLTSRFRDILFSFPDISLALAIMAIL